MINKILFIVVGVFINEAERSSQWIIAVVGAVLILNRLKPACQRRSFHFAYKNIIQAG